METSPKDKNKEHSKKEIRLAERDPTVTTVSAIDVNPYLAQRKMLHRIT
jgi:hypothetical protein